MSQPLDDFLKAELTNLATKTVTINQLIAAVTHSRVYESLERLRASGSVILGIPAGTEHTYGIPPYRRR